MFFLIFSNANVVFKDQELIKKFYTLIKALLITKQIQIINQKKFVVIALDLGKKVFIKYVVYLSSIIMIFLAQDSQIALLITKKVVIFAKYLDYINVFLKKSAIELFKHFNINKYTINLELSKQLLYGLIYSLRSIELEILKTYIEINLVNSFICLSKFFVKDFIFFVQKLDSNIHLYINYCGFNNLIIKN